MSEIIEGVQELLGCARDDIYIIGNYTSRGQKCMPDSEMVAMKLVKEAMHRAAEFVCRQAEDKQNQWRRVLQQTSFAQQLVNGERLVG